MEKEYNIQGKITLKINFDVIGISEENAIKNATNYLKDFYHLDAQGAYHDEDSVLIDIDAIEYGD